jgi:hypothetical protein
MRNHRSQRGTAFIVQLLLAALVAAPAVYAEDVSPTIDFAHEVVPILKEHCLECHGGHRHEGDFSINTRELMVDSGLVEPGDADASHLIALLTTDDAEVRMPKEKPPLPEAAVNTLRKWINDGLPWEPGFSFLPSDYEPPLKPRRPELPPAVDGRANPVDRILDAYFVEHGVTRPAPLEDAEFLRRVYLDITGLLPTTDQLHAFLADKDSNKHEKVIDQLLADPQAYAEHWLTFWNDLLRNDFKGTGYIEGGRKHITGWLYRALLENMPFDAFVRALISPTPESEGFIYGITWRGNVNASQRREVQFAQNVGQVFLGINMKCASCHDSFIDRWTLAETYGLAAIYSEQPLELNRCDKPTGQMAEAAWMFPELGQVDAKAPRDERLRQLAELLTHPENGRLTRTIVNRLWHRLMGRGIVHPVDAMQTEPWSADLLNFLAVYLADNKYDLKSVIRLIATSHAYQSQAVSNDAEPAASQVVFAGPIAKRMTAEQYIDAIWQITGTAPREPHKAVAEFLPTNENSKRTAYRASLVESNLLMRSLGRPTREQVVSERPSMLTTLVALDLSNSPILAETLHRGAPNVRTRFANQDSSQIIDWVYESALSRHPTDNERAVAVDLLGSPATEQGVEDLLWAVFMLPEFQIIR